MIKMISHMKRTVIAILAVFAALSFSSCVRDEEPIFEESASQRLQNALKNAQTVLVGAENGWRMYYYPDPDQAYGGYLYTMKFTQEDVEVWSELFDNSYTSLYRMTTDDGPVLSFDTNNYAFHFFATPSGSGTNLYGDSGHYQAYKGDFEFLIISATKDEVVLKGKRSGNKIKMYPLTGEESPEAVAAAAYDTSEEVFVSSFTGTIGDDAASVSLAFGSRAATITLTDEKYAEDKGASVKVPYAYTENGLLFYNPVKVGPYTLDGFTWNGDTRQLVALTGAATPASLDGKLPDGWHVYADFLGTYTLTYKNGSATMQNITVEQKQFKKTYTIKGLSSKFDVEAIYDLSTGQIGINSQVVGSQGSYDVYACAWDSEGGSLTWNTAAGMFGTLSEDGNTITWGNNGAWEGNNVDAFITWYITSSGSSAGQAGSPWLWSNGSTQLWGWATFTRQ